MNLDPVDWQYRSGPVSPRAYRVVNAQILDPSGGGFTHADIDVVDGVISAINPTGQGITGNLATIDLAGMFLLPGLFNMHTHLSLALPGERGDYLASLNAFGVALYMADAARRTVQAGVTSVRCVAEVDHADFALRDSINRGLATGPNIFTAGRALVCTGGHGHEQTSTLECDGADGFARGVRSQIKAGADLIKVMISGGLAGKHESIDTPQLTKAEMAAVLSTAHDWGRKVTAHAGPAAVIREAVELGLDCVEHGYQLSPEVCTSMADAGTSLVPTLLVTRCGNFFDQLGVPQWMQLRSLQAGPQHVESFQMALDAGVNVMLGSDMPPFWPFEDTTATVREMEFMAEFGMSNQSVLQAATTRPAAWLGVADRLGTLEVGKQADIIALRGDPLEDIRAMRTLFMVIKAGNVVRDDRMAVA